MGLISKTKAAYQEGRYPQEQVPPREIDYLHAIAENTYATSKSVGTIATIVVLAFVLAVLGACASLML